MRAFRNRTGIAVCSAVQLSIAFLSKQETTFFATFGYLFISIGISGILQLSLYTYGILRGTAARIFGLAGTAAAYIGMYSIHLWHGPIGPMLSGLIRPLLGFPTGLYGRFAIYFSGSILIGIIMSKLVEVDRISHFAFFATGYSQLPLLCL
jgi:hypothetical protein